MNHIIKSQQFDKKLISNLFSRADKLSQKNLQPLKGKIMASLFYEPSTRTRFSFESAMLRLGGSVISTENAKEFSSVSKGETLEDTIKTISQYADIIVMRHFEKNASEVASKVSSVPVVNAGDGTGQHPTQALLDLYTIKKELNKIDGISIALVGDLKHGRTIHSLAYLLSKYSKVKLYLVSPVSLRIGEDIKKYLDKQKTFYEELEDLESIINKVDVVYQTRIQKERFKNNKEYEKFKGCYKIDLKLVAKMKPKSIIMHPLPRVDEILPEVDSSPKAIYFKQVKYGLFIRMAILEHLLVKK